MILKSLLQAVSRETGLGSGLLFRHREAVTADPVPSSPAIKHRRKVQGSPGNELFWMVVCLIVIVLEILLPGRTFAERVPQKTDADLFAKAVSLPELIRIALERNPGLRGARYEITLAGKGVEAAKGQRFGRLDLRANDSTYGPRNNKLVAQTLVLDQAQVVQKGLGEFNHNLFGIGGVLTIPIYTGGRITNQIAVEEIAARLAVDRLAQTQDALIFNVSSTYYGILKVHEFIRATDQSTQQLRESKRVIERRFSVGKAASVDVFKVNTRLAAVEQTLIRLRNTQEVLYGVLNILLGMEATGPKIMIQGELTPTPKVLDLNQSVEEALRRQPDILAKEKQVEMQEKKILIARADMLPSVALNGSAQGFTGDHSKLFDQEFAILSASVPIFTGGTLDARVAQERIRLEQIRQELAETRLNVTQEVHAAYLNVVEAEARIKAAQVAMAEAKEVLRVEQLKVSAGRSIIENLLDAQAAELEAEQNFSAAVADSLIQRMALKKGVGGVSVEE